MKKLNVEQIIKKIEEEAKARKAEGPRFDKRDRLQSSTTGIKWANQVKQEKLLYRFAKYVQTKSRTFPFYKILYNTAYKYKHLVPKYDEGIGIEEFMKYHDEEFIRNAFQSILRRDPDPQGFQLYLAKLRTGQLSKAEILGALRFSKEGKENKVGIKGLSARLITASSYRVPVIGYAFSFVSSLARLPKILKNIQQYEAFTNARFSQHVDTFNRVSANMHSISSDMNTRLSTDINCISAELHQIASDVNSKIESLNASKADGQTFDVVSQQVREQKSGITELQNSLRALFMDIKKGRFGSLSPEQVRHIESEEDHLLDSLYVAFEDRFRGKAADIRERLKVYLPLMEKYTRAADSLILDIGCGRGEWLELLKENNYSAKGIDLNRTMVQECRDRGLDVIEADVIEFLKKQKPYTFSAITGLHIIEHLPLKKLVQFLDESLRTLKPGGIVLFETPNPENVLVGATFFHIDPTHGNPLHPLTMEFLLEQRGFQDIEIRRMHPIPIQYIDNEMVQKLLFGPQDYAVIGYKQ